ncbi:fruit protein [Trifolium repens]|nr:fruit protein [Trifolium repens]
MVKVKISIEAAMEGTLHSQRLRWNCHRQAHTTGTNSRGVASDFCLPCPRHLHIIIASMGIEVYKYTDRFIDWESSGVKIVPVLSQPDDSWTGESGFVQAAFTRAKEISNPLSTGAVLCGQKQMTEFVILRKEFKRLDKHMTIKKMEREDHHHPLCDSSILSSYVWSFFVFLTFVFGSELLRHNHHTSLFCHHS